MKNVLGWCVALGCLSLAAAEGEKAEALREWTSVNGNVIEAAFVREGDGKVFLKRPDGTVISTMREKLSPNDLAWIDGRGAAAADGKTQSFNLITSQKEKLELPTRITVDRGDGTGATTNVAVFVTIKRLFVKSYAELTNNHRNDKSLAFLIRDATTEHGWASISAECYPLPNGQKGRLKSLTFYPPMSVELKEAVQIVREKMVVVMPDPVVVKEVREYGMSAWEVQNPPAYISRILLVKDAYSGKISRFMVSFPEPNK